MLNTERVSATVNLNSIRYNIEQVSKRIAKGTGIMAVIKADGYGHGAVAVARTLAGMDSVWGNVTPMKSKRATLRGAACPPSLGHLPHHRRAGRCQELQSPCGNNNRSCGYRSFCRLPPV